MRKCISTIPYLTELQLFFHCPEKDQNNYNIYEDTDPGMTSLGQVGLLYVTDLFTCRAGVSLTSEAWDSQNGHSIH